MSPGCGSFGSSTVRARDWGPGARLGALRPHVGNRSRGEGSGPVSHVYARRTDQRLRATVRGLGARAAIGHPGLFREVRGALFCRGQRLWVQGTGILATGACQSLVMQRPGAPAWVWGAEVCERGVTRVCAWGAKGTPGPRGAPVQLFLKLRRDGERGLPHTSL